MFNTVLKNADEITAYIVECSVGFVDEELIREYFFNCRATLKIVPTKTLKVERTDHHIYEKEKESIYRKLPKETMPPLIIDNGKVLDGNHRLRVAKKRKQKEITIYEIQTF